MGARFGWLVKSPVPKPKCDHKRDTKRGVTREVLGVGLDMLLRTRLSCRWSGYCVKCGVSYDTRGLLNDRIFGLPPGYVRTDDGWYTGPDGERLPVAD